MTTGKRESTNTLPLTARIISALPQSVNVEFQYNQCLLEEYLHFYESPKTCQFPVEINSTGNKTQIMTTMEDDELIKMFICVIARTMICIL